MTLQEYIASLRGRTVAVIGIGVSNTPLLRLLLREGIAVTACDRSDQNSKIKCCFYFAVLQTA